MCSKLGNSTPEKFCLQLYKSFSSNARFTKSRMSRTDFTIKHYAGLVSLLPLLPFPLLQSPHSPPQSKHLRLSPATLLVSLVLRLFSTCALSVLQPPVLQLIPSVHRPDSILTFSELFPLCPSSELFPSSEVFPCLIRTHSLRPPGQVRHGRVPEQEPGRSGARARGAAGRVRRPLCGAPLPSLALHRGRGCQIHLPRKEVQGALRSAVFCSGEG